jgi:hypothetical protein
LLSSVTKSNVPLLVASRVWNSDSGPLNSFDPRSIR